MSKDTEKQSARIMFVEQSKTPLEIAQFLGVNVRTVDRWIKKENWKKIRNAKDNSVQNRVERTELIIDQLTERRIDIIAKTKELEKEIEAELDSEVKKELQGQLFELRKECATLDDGIAKWNKRIENLNKENKITISVYLSVMERIFNDLQQSNEEIYNQTIEFQKEHIQKVINTI